METITCSDSPPLSVSAGVGGYDSTMPVSVLGENNECGGGDLSSSSENAFNMSQPAERTVLEKIVVDELHPDDLGQTASLKSNSCEGSDSGVEVLETPDPHNNEDQTHANEWQQLNGPPSLNLLVIPGAQATSTDDFGRITPVPSCGSSVISSCCSNYDDAYNLLVRRNSTLIDGYKLKDKEKSGCAGVGDGTTSENGSESSSVKSTKVTMKRRTADLRKKVSVNTPTDGVRSASQQSGGVVASTRGCATTGATPGTRGSKLISTPRTKSIDRSHISGIKTPGKTISGCRAVSQTRTRATPDALHLNGTSTNATPTGEVHRNVTLTRGSSNVRRSLSRSSSSAARTPSATPTDDGRWPSVHSKPAPLLMTRSLRGTLNASEGGTAAVVSPAIKTTRISRMNDIMTTSHIDAKSTIEKYATLPRRRKERNPPTAHGEVSVRSRDSSLTRISPFTTPSPSPVTTATLLRRQTSRETATGRTLPPYPKKPSTTSTNHHYHRSGMTPHANSNRILIYHETAVQTALTRSDIESALAGIQCFPVNPYDVERSSVGIQADRQLEEVEKLQETLRLVTEQYARLQADFVEQKVDLEGAQRELRDERLEKDGLRTELRNNSDRVCAILGSDNNDSQGDSDSLMILETKVNTEKQLILKQETDISELHSFCRTLQKNLDQSLARQSTLERQCQEQKAESEELQEFMQAEKSTLCDALKESENEISRLKALVTQRSDECDSKEAEYKQALRLSEQKRQENMGLQARLIAMEAKCRELLVYQGSTVSGASVALTALITRLEGLIDELIKSYNISEQELEDVIFHNEAYSNSCSSADTTPDMNNRCITEKMAPSSPKRASSFVSAVINAIKNAAAQSPFAGNRDFSKEDLTENSDSAELLDSETEPCLMMEHVLEDVVLPDTHSHNMVSSGIGYKMLNSSAAMRLTQSESLNSLPMNATSSGHSKHVSASNHQPHYEVMSRSLTDSFNMSSAVTPTPSSGPVTNVSLVDQIIYVDNLVTRLLKVIRIVQMEGEAYTNELMDERDTYSNQARTQKETNLIVVQQLRDWEQLGAQLKSEVEQLMNQLSGKNSEIEDLRADLNVERNQVEKLNKDVCELSTALSTSETQVKETAESDAGEQDLSAEHSVCNEVQSLKDALAQKEQLLNDLSEEFTANRRLLTDNLRNAVSEAKKQYSALDSALETLHSIQSVVVQCPALAQLQRDLEEISFQSASAMPLVVPAGDYNANAGLLQAVANLEISAPIDTSA